MVPVPSQRTAKQGAPSPRKAATAPQRDSHFATTGLAALRRMRTGLIEEESKVSYWRRIIQAKIDLVGSPTRSPGVEGLSEILAEARISHRRVAALSVDAVDDMPPLPDLAQLWDSVPGADPAARQSLIDALGVAEEQLSRYRHDLHARIDRVTHELIARYRENPTLALTALNERMSRH